MISSFGIASSSAKV